MHSGKPRNLREALKGRLSKKEFSLLRAGFDSVGDIAIIEVPKQLEKKEKEIAEALLRVHKQFKAVCKKAGAHKGKYRIEPVKWLAGKKTLQANYIEWGSRFKVWLGKTYFSPRLSNERQRIAKAVKPGEKVAVFFAGVGPFAVQIARHSKAEKVYALEWNAAAFKQLKENISLNKVQGKVDAIKGDVAKTAKKISGECDRIVMPLPESAHKYLKQAFLALKPEGGTVHYYCFAPAKEPFREAEKLFVREAQKAGRKARVVGKKIARPYAKDCFQVVMDFKIV